MTDNPYRSPREAPGVVSPVESVFPEQRGLWAYRGAANWALIWALTFITAQLLWHCARFFRRYDVLEIPMSLAFSPLAIFVDPHDGMANRPAEAFLFALPYWIGLYGVALFLSRKRIHPAVPAAAILLFTCVCGVAYAMFFVSRGPTVCY